MGAVGVFWLKFLTDLFTLGKQHSAMVNFSYQETILVHPRRRQSFVGNYTQVFKSETLLYLVTRKCCFQYDRFTNQVTGDKVLNCFQKYFAATFCSPSMKVVF